jgi:Fic family protein
MKTFASTLLQARQKKQLLARDVAQSLGVDAALVSRFENGNRMPTRKQVVKLAEVLELNSRELLVQWMGGRLLAELRNEPLALEALLLAEEQIRYSRKDKKETAPPGLKTKLQKVDGLKKQLAKLRHLDSYRITEALALEYTYQSNRIEGNTLTLKETELVVNKGLTIAGKSMREHLEAINHGDAIAFIFELVNKKTPFTESKLLQIHNLLLRGIDAQNAGKYRTVQVYISGSEHIPPQPFLVAKKMEEYFEWYEANKDAMHPLLLAAEMHERLVTIHPFIDGNGRTARLVMNLLLLRAGFVIANIKGDTKSRMAYYTALEMCQNQGNKKMFLQFIVETEIAALEKYLQILKV